MRFILKLLADLFCMCLCVSFFFNSILKGIALSNGYLWKKQRKFAHTHLRYFGEGTKSLENYTEVESNFLCEAFKEEQGKRIADTHFRCWPSSEVIYGDHNLKYFQEGHSTLTTPLQMQ